MKFINITKSYKVSNEHPENKADEENDYVVKSMGAFGPWQAVICFLIAVTRLLPIFHSITILFITPTTEFVCTEFSNTPDVIENSTCYKNCLKYEYQSAFFESTIISEFDLICDREWLASLAQSTFIFGIFWGTTVGSWTSDRYGRRPTLLLCIVACLMFSISSPFASDYWTLSCLRFLTGVTCGGISASSMVILAEVVGSKYRELGGFLGQLLDGVYYGCLVIIAYYTNTWKTFLLSVGLFSLLILLSLAFIPETPRWLIANRHTKRAIEMMTKAARFNNLSTNDIKDNVNKSIKVIENAQQTNRIKPTFVDLFKTRELRVKTVASLVMWLVLGFCFYGISQYLTFLGSNLYIIVGIQGLSQIIATGVGTIITKLFGRIKPTCCINFAIGLIMSMTMFFSDDQLLITIIAITGFFLSSVLFSIAYVQVNELFPTVLRTTGSGICVSACLFGMMVAPFVANLKPFWLSSLIFGISSFIGAFVSVAMPETKNVQLKDIIE